MLVCVGLPLTDDGTRKAPTLSDRLIDKVLDELKTSGVLDPLKLPNSTVEVGQWIFKLKADIYRVLLFGLNSLQRTGSAKVNISDLGIGITVDLGAGPLQVTGVGIVTALGFSQAITIEANVSHLEVLLQADQ